jgi:hypothetical protein
MKFPSVRLALQEAGQTLLRFPLVLLDAAIGTVAAVLLTDHEGPAQATVLFKVLFAAILGMPLLIALVLAAEKRGWSKGTSWSVQSLGILVLVAYATTIPANLEVAPKLEVLRLLVLAVALHLLVAVAPFTSKGETLGFWQFNKSLFFRALTAGLVTHVLYAGLALALAAMDNLFGLEIVEKRYAQLWMSLVGLVCTWFFLAGIPRILNETEYLAEYPKGLRMFTNYALLPLVLIYLTILTAYLAKILVSWEWPEGWVSKLILGFAVTGLFSYLLLYPVVTSAEGGWLKRAPRWLFVALIPLVVMLFLALWRRVSEYGWTEDRYLAAAIGVWLVIIAGYFLFRKQKDIRFIPATLCAAALVLSYGPWSPFAVSERSQVNRLQNLLTRNSILVNGSVCKSGKDVPARDVREVSAVLDYVHEFHGFGRIQPWFSESLSADSVGDGAYKKPEYVAGLLGLKYMHVRPGPSGGVVMLDADKDAIVAIDGFNRLVRGQRIANRQNPRVKLEEGISYRVSDDLGMLTLMVGSDGKVDTAAFDIRSAVDSLLKEYEGANNATIPPQKMMIASVSGGLKAKVCLRQVNVRRETATLKFFWYIADFLIEREH